MTPSQERQIMKNVKALIAANEALDKKQGEDIAALKKKVKELEKKISMIRHLPKKPGA